MAMIERRGQSQWRARVRRMGFKGQTKTFKTKANAVAWAADIERQMDDGTFVDRSAFAKVTLGSLLKKYVEKMTPMNGCTRQEISLIAGLREHAIAARFITALDSADIAQYRDERLKEVSPAVVTKEMALISTVFSIAATEWRMNGLLNPVEGVRRPKVSKDHRSSLTTLEELVRALENTDAAVLKSLLLAAAETVMHGTETALAPNLSVEPFGSQTPKTSTE